MRHIWLRLALAVPVLMTGCKGFWDPIGTDYALTNSGAISVTTNSSSTSTITVTPSNSFTGTVSLACAVTTSPSSAASPVTCSLSSSSVSISSTTPGTATLTATTTSTTTVGTYEITVTGTSGGASASTTVCVAVGASSGSCTSASTSGNFYILSSTSISGYSISSGAVSAISGSSISNFTGATAMAIAPNGGFLYVASASGLVLYTINTSTGALSQGSAVFTDTDAQAIKVDPTGRWLLDASGTGNLNAYPITSSGAQDTSRTAQTMTLASTSVEPGGMAVSSATGTPIIAVALGATGTQAFPFTASNNTSPIGTAYTKILTPFSNGGQAVAVAIDPQNRLLYIGETDPGALRVYTIGSVLTEFTYSSPYAPTGTRPQAILPTADGSYVYVASWQSGSAGVITGYSVATSALTLLSGTSDTGTEPSGLAEDSSSSFVLAVSNSGNTLSAYTIGSSGELSSPLTDSPVTTPIAIVAVP